MKTLETQVEELKVQLKNSQKNEFKKKAKVESKRAIPELEEMNQLKDMAHLSKVQEYTQGNIHSQFCS